MTCRRRLRTLALGACGVGVAVLAACGDLRYGASFGYPSDPPVPPGATVIADAKGWDDDDPMRGREVVIDVGTAGPDELIEFYRGRFSPDEGWQPGQPDPDVGGGHLLCLVNHADETFDEYVEIYAADRRAEPTGPHRYRASVSRLYAPPGRERTIDRCGLAGTWFPDDPEDRSRPHRAVAGDPLRGGRAR